MNKWDKAYFSDKKKARIKADRSKGLTLSMLKEKYGGSIAGLQRICADQEKGTGKTNDL